jgi:Fe2+ or Zn2+ uptake regulation protein
MKMKDKKSIDIFRDFLKENDRNYTVEREALLNVFKTMKEPLTLPQVYKKANKKNAVHAKSTLYRNIFLFVDAGLLRAKRLPNGKTTYMPTSRLV